MATKSKAAKAAAATSNGTTVTNTNNTGDAQTTVDTSAAQSESTANVAAVDSSTGDTSAPASETTGAQDGSGSQDAVEGAGQESPPEEAGGDVTPPPAPETLTAPPPPSPEEQAQSTAAAPQTSAASTETPPIDTTVAPAPVSQVGELADPILDELGIEKARALLADVPPAHYAVLAVLNRYVADTTGGHAVSEDQIARNQDGVFRVMQNLINREEQYFTPLFTVLMLWFEKHGQTALHPHLAHRAEHLMRLNPDDLRSYNNLIDLFRRMGPVKGRALEKKQISFERALQYGLTDAGRSRVSNFFDV
jgi:hypothetical protein